MKQERLLIHFANGYAENVNEERLRYLMGEIQTIIAQRNPETLNEINADDLKLVISKHFKARKTADFLTDIKNKKLAKKLDSYTEKELVSFIALTNDINELRIADITLAEKRQRHAFADQYHDDAVDTIDQAMMTLPLSDPHRAYLTEIRNKKIIKELDSCTNEELKSLIELHADPSLAELAKAVLSEKEKKHNIPQEYDDISMDVLERAIDLAENDCLSAAHLAFYRNLSDKQTANQIGWLTSADLQPLMDQGNEPGLVRLAAFALAAKNAGIEVHFRQNDKPIPDIYNEYSFVMVAERRDNLLCDYKKQLDEKRRDVKWNSLAPLASIEIDLGPHQERKESDDFLNIGTVEFHDEAQSEHQGVLFYPDMIKTFVFSPNPVSKLVSGSHELWPMSQKEKTDWELKQADQLQNFVRPANKPMKLAMDAKNIQRFIALKESFELPQKQAPPKPPRTTSAKGNKI